MSQSGCGGGGLPLETLRRRYSATMISIAGVVARTSNTNANIIIAIIIRVVGKPRGA